MKPGKHTDHCMKNISDRVSTIGANQDSYKRNLQKKRSQNSTIERLPRPESLKKWVIPDSLRYIMMYDSAETLGEHRFILLSTDEDLMKLAKCQIVFSDGTFKVPEFYQVSFFLMH